jgi:IK cytokine
VFKSDVLERNELFLPGRMAYLVDLEEEGDNAYDIPTTLIRSKADIAGNVLSLQVLFF